MDCNITYPVLMMSCLHNVLETPFMISSNNSFKNITIQEYKTTTESKWATLLGPRAVPH